MTVRTLFYAVVEEEGLNLARRIEEVQLDSIVSN